MKIKNIFITTAVLAFSLSSVSAEYVVYDNVSDFEVAKWSVCEAATDGCNSYFMTDWKVMWWTKMYCADTKVEWTCTKYKDDIMTTTAVTTASVDANTESTIYWKITKIEDGKDWKQVYITTSSWIEYSTAVSLNDEIVNKELGIKLWNSVIVYYSEKLDWMNLLIGDKIKIVWVWLSDNDESFYNSIKSKLDSKYQNKVNDLVIKYDKIISKLSFKNKVKINNLFIDKLETKISEFLSKFPQDKWLSESDNNVYLTLSLLKLELMKLNFLK